MLTPFDRPLSAFIDEFEEFLELPLTEQLAILP